MKVLDVLSKVLSSVKEIPVVKTALKNKKVNMVLSVLAVVSGYLALSSVLDSVPVVKKVVHVVSVALTVLGFQAGSEEVKKEVKE